MSYECFEVSIDQNIAHIVMNRPEKRNNMNATFGMNCRQLFVILTNMHALVSL